MRAGRPRPAWEVNLRPEHFRDILGETFVRASGETLIQLGHRRYDRFRLGEIGVPQIKAARMLNLVLRRWSITTAAQLAARVHELPSLRGIGHAAFYAALAILADADQEDAAVRHYERAATRPNGQAVKFATFKAHERKRAIRHRRETHPRTRRYA